MAQKILVCDDSRTIQQAVAVALFEMKADLVMVSDPGQLIATALEEAPQLILLDNRMNREGRDDGYELCQQLKDHDDLKHIPVIFLAGRSYEPQKGRNAGAFDFIEKPFETQMLADKVQAGLSASPGEVVRPKVPTSSSGSSDFRATTALPTFSPVDLQNMLPPDAKAALAPPPLSNVEDLAPPLPPALSFAEDDEDLSPPPPPSLSFADDADEDLSPPSAPPSFHFNDEKPASPKPLSFDDDAEDALPPPPPFGFNKPVSPVPPSFENEAPTPPPLPFSNVAADDDDDLSRDDAPPPPPPSPFGFAKATPPPQEARPLRQTPVIPPPTDSPKEFPVRELFRPSEEPPRPPNMDSEPDNTIVAMSPNYEEAATPVTPPPSFSPPPPDFAMAPDRNYLAKALEGSRKRFRRGAAAPSSAVEGAQMEYIRQLSQETITRIAWEVVPELAEIIIREALSKRQ